MLPQPVLALLLLFPVTKQYHEYCKEQEVAMASQPPVSDQLFYMKQTISNACGTVALIHSVANNCGPGRDIQLVEGSSLNTFLTSTKTSSPAERAEKLEADDSICQSHDAAAREGQTCAPDREESVDYHFVAFVQVEGQLYELDGRKSAPIVKGKSSQDSFLTDAAAACKEYMERDPENINFTMVALTAKSPF